jgi:hypothetical protein
MGGNMSRSIRGWLESLSAEGPVRLALYVFALVTVIVIAISFRLYNKEFFEGVLVEAHGMLFDLLVIGVFVLWLNKLGERRLTIRRYREEIEDFLGWDSDEAMHRIAGNIKRLNREGVTKIWLVRAYLPRANLSLADLRDTNLRGAQLTKADLSGAQLDNADLHEANLRRADLIGADLIGADLRDANLRGADLAGADLRGAKYNENTAWPEGFTPPPEALKET